MGWFILREACAYTALRAGVCHSWLFSCVTNFDLGFFLGFFIMTLLPLNASISFFPSEKEMWPNMHLLIYTLDSLLCILFDAECSLVCVHVISCLHAAKCSANNIIIIIQLICSSRPNLSFQHWRKKKIWMDLTTPREIIVSQTNHYIKQPNSY